VSPLYQSSKLNQKFRWTE